MSQSEAEQTEVKAEGKQAPKEHLKIVVTGGAGFLGYHINLKINQITDYKNTLFFDIAEFEER